MEVIDTDMLDMQEAHIERVNNIKEKIENRKMLQDAKPKPPPKMRIKMPKPSRVLKAAPDIDAMMTKTAIRKATKEEENEVFISVQKSIFKVLSMPMKEPSKRPILAKKLEDSKFANKYVKENIYNGYLSTLNDHAKFAFLYGYHFANTLVSQ